jgi:hypothetical protein
MFSGWFKRNNGLNEKTPLLSKKAPSQAPTPKTPNLLGCIKATSDPNRQPIDDQLYESRPLPLPHPSDSLSVVSVVYTAQPNYHASSDEERKTVGLKQ